MLQQCADRNTDGVHGKVAPEEGKAEDETDEFNVPQLVNPIGLVELADFNGVCYSEADNDQSACCGRTEYEAQHEEDRHCPQTITDIIDVEIRQVLWDKSAGQAEQKQHSDSNHINDSMAFSGH